MWKDFFYYSKSERRSILFLVGMGILLSFSGWWFRRCGPSEDAFLKVDSLALDSFCVRRYQQKAKFSAQKRKPSQLVPTLFDPNTLDSVGFCQLGLPPFLAKRIVKYRERGGVFHTPEDFSRIYGLSDQQYQRLRPYINIDTIHLAHCLHKRNEEYRKVKEGRALASSVELIPSHKSLDSTRTFRSSQPAKYPEGTLVDLNSADTLQLRRVPGIGVGLSKMIIAYRNRLGGYSHVSQLQEVAAIDTAVNRWFKVDSCICRPLRINRANLDQLRNHPYMNFYKARAILEYRRKRGPIKSLSQLSMFQEFTEGDIQRLTPYLDFK